MTGPESNKSLSAWLGLEHGARLWVGGRNRAARRELERHLAGFVRPPTGPVDAALVAPATLDEAVYFVRKILPRLAPGGMIAVATPPRSRGLKPRGSACAGPAGHAEMHDAIGEKALVFCGEVDLGEFTHWLIFRVASG